MPERIIHVAPGTSAAGCLKQSLRPSADTLLANQDMLSCGPLPHFSSIAQWRNVREGYLRTLYPDWQDFSFADKVDLLTNAESLRPADRIILWIGTGLAEQLLLAWMVQLLGLLRIPLDRLRVVQFVRESTKGFEVHSLGVLHPDQLRQHPQDEPLTQADIDELHTAWDAVTASDPSPLLEFCADQRDQMPHLRRSMRHLINRFPDHQTGLNSWEEELLKYTRDKGPVTTRVIGYTMGYSPDVADWVGDAYLFARLRRLADQSLPTPFLSIQGGSSMRGTEVKLTSHGIQALAGTVNFVELNGIDDWVGGIHLDSVRGRVWFRHDTTLVAA